MAATMEVLEPLSPEQARQHDIWRKVEVVRRLSDRIVGIGAFGVGLDGLLTWIPGVGGLYSAGAGGYLLYQAVRAKASAATIARMSALLGADLLTTEIPLIGDTIDFFLPAHLLAADALQKEIEARYGPPEGALAERDRRTWKRRFGGGKIRGRG